MAQARRYARQSLQALGLWTTVQDRLAPGDSVRAVLNGRLQPVRVVDIRRGGVLRADRPAHPLLVPAYFIHAVVITAGIRHTGGVNLRMKQQRRYRTLATGRSPINAHACGHIVPGELLSRGLMPQNSVRETGIGQILPGDIMKGFRAVAGAHTVNLYYHKA